jgi:hypothetical protein
MSPSDENRRLFFESLETSLATGTFRRATISKPIAETPWKRIGVSIFTASAGSSSIAFDYDNGRQIERKNTTPQEALDLIIGLVPIQYSAVHLRLADEELQVEQSNQGTFRLKRRPAEKLDDIPAGHNREKNYLIPATASFLVGVGIASKIGAIKRERYDKFRQINKFIEVIASLLPSGVLSSDRGVTAVDFGSGKHYLTFALSEYLTKFSAQSSVTGVEQRPELVQFGQELARSLGWTQLRFTGGTIADTPLRETDLVVALHACDTATDDAIARAVKADARFICVAPCCHKYVRNHFHPPEDLKAILRHGIIQERFAEGLTDSLRVLVLEALGYQTKLFEFISLEHTAKNVMITAARTGRPNPSSLEALRALKEKFKLTDFYLDRVLAERLHSVGPIAHA